ncbi:MAG: carboxylesterase family protein [Mycobacterium sp.]
MKRALGVVLAVALSLMTAPAAAAEPVIAVETGQLRGVVSDGIESWKGIPFAAPPTGALRWRPPQPAAPWPGVREAAGYGNDCMQLPFPSDAAPLGAAPAEDCLYLNVWRPGGGPVRDLPVVVWIHGGGFVNGGASPAVYSGAELARHGVVVASFNYRLGRFGTFAHPQLTQERPDGLLGNYGVMDQIAAMQWVQRNISAFGGDPRNVTVMGESAGGMAIHTLLTSPRAQGLVQRAVIMSGGDGSVDDANLADVEQIGVRFADAQGIGADDPDALTELRALSPEQIRGDLNMGKLFGSDQRDFASPFAEGVTVVDPAAAYRADTFDHVPIMVGATSADIGGRDGVMVAGARQVASLLAAKVPVYAYRFSYVAGSGDRTAGAPHATDVPFFLHTEATHTEATHTEATHTEATKYGDQTTAEDTAVGATISAYVVNFARTGDPNGPGLAAWPRYVPADDVIMDFAASGAAVPQRDPWG